eukprot:CAMPEP_0182892530 /NCGR_PEP_ID=MMETSP0034_2-20130328/23924_1 /TAXON_ID=156128 /ORGANISM="Nephroselmis pyriformis, Strain CCMP717" /LENGTH=146 /DNA_ID=CAMNT_0025026215 /DNA_START=94 /DNA_END=532 /DNA_ORIENTATION=+
MPPSHVCCTVSSAACQGLAPPPAPPNRRSSAWSILSLHPARQVVHADAPPLAPRHPIRAARPVVEDEHLVPQHLKCVGEGPRHKHAQELFARLSIREALCQLPLRLLHQRALRREQRKSVYCAAFKEISQVLVPPWDALPITHKGD